MDLQKFKREFRGKALDFAVSGHLVKVFSSKNKNQKDKDFEELYRNLEEWVIKQFTAGMTTVADHFPSSEELSELMKKVEDTTMPLDF